MYVPPLPIIELSDIIREDKLKNKAQGWKEMVKYVRLGREITRFAEKGYKAKVTLPPVDIFYKRKKWQ